MSSDVSSEETSGGRERVERRHLQVGWLAVSGFIALGLFLEILHGLKASYLLDVQNEVRRHMFTLAHAHGTLIGLMNLAFAYSVSRIQSWSDQSLPLASRALLAATLLVPGGFLLGGIMIHSGDPGLGILLVPPGALLLLFAAIAVTRAAQRE